MNVGTLIVNDYFFSPFPEVPIQKPQPVGTFKLIFILRVQDDSDALNNA